MTKEYWRPVPLAPGEASPPRALPLAGGPYRFAHLVRHRRGAEPVFCDIADAPDGVLARLSEPRAPRAGLIFDRPRVMGILNVTPDSFSDGGDFETGTAAVAHGHQMARDGADILDIGGESTRPGADVVAPQEESARVVPVIAELARKGATPLSIDTRNAATGEAALGAGAGLFNDVSALSHDPQSADVAAKTGAALCLMHAQGDPKTMQANPRYDDVLLDVFDYLQERIAAAEAAGINRSAIIADPGIGFGKTAAHNLRLLAGLALFHGLGVPILVGASRKRFIGSVGGAETPKDRMPGSVAVAVMAALQGAQVLRVHDVAATVQALRLCEAIARAPMGLEDHK